MKEINMPGTETVNSKIEKEQQKKIIGGCYPVENKDPRKSIDQLNPVKSFNEMLKDLLIIH
jgi:hypothetical protein